MQTPQRHKSPPLNRAGFCQFLVEQVTGLEPVISAWKANVLPLHYTCLFGYIARDWLNPEMLIWSGRRGSNPPPQPWQGCALPNELLPQKDQSLKNYCAPANALPLKINFLKGCALPNELLPQIKLGYSVKGFWCGRRDLNSYAFWAPEPKSGASANSATPAHIQALNKKNKW